MNDLREKFGSNPFADTDGHALGYTTAQLNQAVADGILWSAYKERSKAPKAVRDRADALVFVFRGLRHEWL